MRLKEGISWWLSCSTAEVISRRTSSSCGKCMKSRISPGRWTASIAHWIGWSTCGSKEEWLGICGKRKGETRPCRSCVSGVSGCGMPAVSPGRTNTGARSVTLATFQPPSSFQTMSVRTPALSVTARKSFAFSASEEGFGSSGKRADNAGQTPPPRPRTRATASRILGSRASAALYSLVAACFSPRASWSRPSQ